MDDGTAGPGAPRGATLHGCRRVRRDLLELHPARTLDQHTMGVRDRDWPGNPRVFHHANVILDRSHAARRRESSPGSGFPGMAWRADPGMDLILNVHVKPSGKEETVNPVIGLYFTEKP